MHIDEITPYENNPRVNEAAIQAVADSIKEFGFKVPIIIDEEQVIVTGHTRYEAAKLLEMDTVPCILADDLSDEQIKAFRLVDNKTAEYASWDLSKLNIELEELSEMEIDMSQFGFKFEEKDIEDDGWTEETFEQAVSEINEPMTKLGDVYKLGNNVLMCGDGTKETDVEKLMQGYKAVLCVTDPPYNVALGYDDATEEDSRLRNRRTDGKKIMNDHMEDKEFRSFLKTAFERMHESLMNGSPIYVFHADGESYNFRGAFNEAGFKLAQCIIWVKNSMVLGRQDYQWRHEPILYGWKPGTAHNWYGNRDKDTVIDDTHIVESKTGKKELISIIKELKEKLTDMSSVIYHDRPSISADHPTMKPVKLIGKLIQNSSQKGDMIIDFFGGSGSTLIASQMTGRMCHTMELDPFYCDVIIRRWEELTGEIAERVV